MKTILTLVITLLAISYANAANPETIASCIVTKIYDPVLQNRGVRVDSKIEVYRNNRGTVYLAIGPLLFANGVGPNTVQIDPALASPMATYTGMSFNSRSRQYDFGYIVADNSLVAPEGVLMNWDMNRFSNLRNISKQLWDANNETLTMVQQNLKTDPMMLRNSPIPLKVADIKCVKQAAKPAAKK